MADLLRVVQCGLGPIGQAVARLVLSTPGLKLFGAADSADEKAGRDLGTVMGLGRKLRVKVEADAMRAVRKGRPRLAVVSTVSGLNEVKPLILGLVQRGLHVVTTCEELAFPTPAHQDSFRAIDRAARKKRVSVLSAGVNPGFTMDLLPLMLTAPCVEVKRIAVARVVDLATRRLSLKRKVGAGLNQQQFRRALAEGVVRHIGLLESAHMIAPGLGWSLDRLEETIEPAIAPRDLDTEHLRIPAGAVSGIKQHARAYRKGELILSLDLQMYVGAESPRDHILVDGTPPIDLTIAGGIAGDVATAAIVVNSLPRLFAAPPGLLTMRDLPIVTRFNVEELQAALKKRKK
jgi:2,4-diaminopentanoate dehydrogenase